MATIDSRAHLLLTLLAASILTHLLVAVRPIGAVGGGSSGSAESTSSSQPLWSYQVKPTTYVGAQAGQTGAYTAMPSLFDAFSGLSQRQGALTSSPLMSILPIILIAAGGMLLLLPLLTMMMASPFGGLGAGGYQGFGYPQMGALNKRRSLDGQRGLVELFEQVSSTIEELTKRYSSPAATSGQSSAGGQQQQPYKRAKSMGSLLANELQTQQVAPANHKQAEQEGSGVVNSLSSI